MCTAIPEKERFKDCSLCGFCWKTRQDFLCDPDIEIIGYQAHFEALVAGTFLFNHACRTTLAVPAGEFQDLYDGPMFRTRATGGEDCPGHCLNRHDLSPCRAECECAYVREIVQIIRDWPKIELEV